MLDFEEGELAAKPLGRLARLLGDLDRVALQKGLRTGLRKMGFLQLKLWTPVSPSLRGIKTVYRISRTGSPQFPDPDPSRIGIA